MSGIKADVRDFFISRTDSDKAIAVAVAEIIREVGLTTWLQDENFGHASFMARMEEGLDGGARLIALLSQDYQRSRYCRAEYSRPWRGAASSSCLRAKTMAQAHDGSSRGLASQPNRDDATSPACGTGLWVAGHAIGTRLHARPECSSGL